MQTLECRMDLKQLRALQAVAETGSVTRAADILHIVQPAISRQLRLLEEELGATLFDRERHGMVLTPAGRQFLGHVRRALDALDRGKAELRPSRREISGSVVVGLLPSTADEFVTSLMDRLRGNYPHIHVRSSIAYGVDLEAAMEKGDIDVALLYLKPGVSPRFPCTPLLEEALYLVGPPDAGLDLNTPVPLSFLNEVPLVLPSSSRGVRRLVESECAAENISLNVASETDSISLQKAMVMKGHGLSVLAGFSIAHEVARGDLSACPIAAVSMKRTLYVCQAFGRMPSPAAATVLDELKELIRQCVHSGGWPGATLSEP
jgi:LysR family transcriptional regulator, nitrogen assimilation regulatory protein